MLSSHLTISQQQQQRQQLNVIRFRSVFLCVTLQFNKILILFYLKSIYLHKESV